MAAEILKIWRKEHWNVNQTQKTINSKENKQDKQNKGPIVRPSEVHFREITQINLDHG